jgi:hypothetical protein
MGLPTEIYDNEPRPWADPPENLRWRVYFNCRVDYPVIWCVDNGTVETQVRLNWVDFQNVSANGATCLTGSNSTRPWRHRNGLPGKRPHNEPYAWVELDAIAIFHDGGVSFYGSK